jgi:hypothetical protein
MDDKRRYRRFPCSIKVDFEYFEGEPGEIDTETALPIKGKGMILDISVGGVSGVKFEGRRESSDQTQVQHKKPRLQS